MLLDSQIVTWYTSNMVQNIRLLVDSFPLSSGTPVFHRLYPHEPLVIGRVIEAKKDDPDTAKFQWALFPYFDEAADPVVVSPVKFQEFHATINIGQFRRMLPKFQNVYYHFDRMYVTALNAHHLLAVAVTNMAAKGWVAGLGNVNPDRVLQVLDKFAPSSTIANIHDADVFQYMSKFLHRVP